MKIQGHEVEIKKGGIKVGCTEVSLEEMEKLIEQVKKKNQLGVDHIFDEVMKDYNDNDLEATTDVVKKIREKFDNNFMAIRSGGLYSHRGFFLSDSSNTKSWKIVVDNFGFQVLVLDEEVNE